MEASLPAGGARRARSVSPVRQGSTHWDRGYESQDEGDARYSRRPTHTLSNTLPYDPLNATFGEDYSPLRSAIRPGSFTYKSTNDLGASMTL